MLNWSVTENFLKRKEQLEATIAYEYKFKHIKIAPSKIAFQICYPKNMNISKKVLIIYLRSSYAQLLTAKQLLRFWLVQSQQSAC